MLIGGLRVQAQSGNLMKPYFKMKNKEDWDIAHMKALGLISNTEKKKAK